MQRKTYSARALIGHPYGSVFEIQNKKVVLAGGPLAGGLDLDDLNTAEAGEEGAEPAGDTDIASLKASGASGKDILSAMVGNCASFAGKTRFSQEKYVRRKAAKYIVRFRLLKSCARYLCEALFIRQPRQICFLRYDSLAQLLCFANVRAGMDIIVVESCAGFVTGCVAERMGGVGRIFNVHPYFHPNLAYFYRFNIECDAKQLVVGLPMDLLAGTLPLSYTGKLLSGSSAGAARVAGPASTDVDTTSGAVEAPSEPAVPTVVETSAAVGDAAAEVEGLPIEESKAADGEEAVEGDVDGKRKGVPFNRSSKKHKRLMEATPEERAAQRLSAQKAPALALSHLRTHGADALVIVLEAHPLALLLQTIRLLKPSSPFVVFSTQLTPLVECQRQLRHYRMAAGLRLQETWTRGYQMLEGRVHPEMLMSGNPGYLLCGSTLMHPHIAVRIHDSHDPLVYAPPPPESTLKSSKLQTTAASSGGDIPAEGADKGEL